MTDPDIDSICGDFVKEVPFRHVILCHREADALLLYSAKDDDSGKAAIAANWSFKGTLDFSKIAFKGKDSVLFRTDVIPGGALLSQIQRLACCLNEFWFCLKNASAAAKTKPSPDMATVEAMAAMAVRIGQTDRWSVNPGVSQLNPVNDSEKGRETRVLFDPASGAYYLCFRKPDYTAPENHCLMHVHIPKNGGTSLHELLTSNFSERHHSLYFDDPMRLHSPASLSRHLLEHPETEVISSHEIRQFPPRCGGRLALYFCFLRDPAQRNLSYFRYVQKDWDALSPEHKKRLPENPRAMTANQFFNWCQANLKGYAPMAAQTHFLSQTYRWESAREVLEKFIFVGITERFEESMLCFQTILGNLGIPFKCRSIPQQNATLDRSKGASKQVHSEPPDLLKSGVDRELYDWANRRLDRLISDFRLK